VKIWRRTRFLPRGNSSQNCASREAPVLGLCGITRFLVGKEFRRQGREPLHAASHWKKSRSRPRLRHRLLQAVSREEEAILWRALERIPDTYREPLILFYREESRLSAWQPNWS